MTEFFIEKVFFPTMISFIIAITIFLGYTTFETLAHPKPNMTLEIDKWTCTVSKKVNHGKFYTTECFQYSRIEL
jgi:hypothetical protein